MFNFFILCAVFFGSSHGWTDEEVKLDFVKVVMKCNKDIHVEPQHLITLQKKVMPDDPASACLIACAYKKTGMMDDQGMYSMEGAAKLSDKYYGDNPTKLESSKNFSEFCKKVNDEKVSDGEKGCDRAVLLFRCLVDNAANYGIKV